jgi:hypothetical protein
VCEVTHTSGRFGFAADEQMTGVARLDAQTRAPIEVFRSDAPTDRWISHQTTTQNGLRSEP